jgi:hypothetical protein
MGLLSKLFGKEHHAKHSNGARETDSQPYFTRTDIPSLAKNHEDKSDESTQAVTGDIEYQLYVYNGVPLRGLRRGNIFTAQIAQGHVSLVSSLTGGIWDSRIDDGFALSYQGMPFGASFNNELREYLRHVHARAVTVRHDGWYDRASGIPELKILAPSTRHSPTSDTAARLAGVSRFDVGSIDIASVNIGRHSGAIESLLHGRQQCDTEASLNLIPTPKGSAAKPHIAIRSAQGSVVLAEINARQPAYKELSPAIGKTVKANIEKRKSFDENNDDGYYYRLILVL